MSDDLRTLLGEWKALDAARAIRSALIGDDHN